jgi:hypothetical protein
MHLWCKIPLGISRYKTYMPNIGDWLPFHILHLDSEEGSSPKLSRMILFTLSDISRSKLQDCSHYKRNGLLQISYKTIVFHVQSKYWESIPILCGKVFICTRMKHFSDFKILTFGPFILRICVSIWTWKCSLLRSYGKPLYVESRPEKKNKHVISSHFKNNNNSDKYRKSYLHVTL